MKDNNLLPTILVITHVIPFPPAAGNEIRILKMLKWLKKEGYRTVLILNHASLDPNVLKSLQEIVDAVHLIDIDDSEVDLELLNSYNSIHALLPHSFIKRIMNIVKVSFVKLFMKEALKYEIESKLVKTSLCPDKLIYMTHELCVKYKPFAVITEYIFTSPCLNVVPSGVLKIIDTHDMFSRKKKQVIKYGIKDMLHCTPQEERNYLLKSDVIIAIQAKEAKMFKDLVPEREVLVLGIDYDIVTEIDNSKVIPGTILIVGSDNPLNVHGLKEFYQNAWPTIRNRNPNALLRIVGRIGNKFKKSDKRVQIIGWVENLEDEYKRAALVINPTVAGTGLKIKNVEALCEAKPLVTTLNGAEGLLFTDDPPFVICSNWSEFSDAVIALLESEDKRSKLQRRALEFAKQNFEIEQVYASLSQTFERFSCVRSNLNLSPGATKK